MAFLSNLSTPRGIIALGVFMILIQVLVLIFRFFWTIPKVAYAFVHVLATMVVDVVAYANLHFGVVPAPVAADLIPLEPTAPAH